MFNFNNPKNKRTISAIVILIIIIAMVGSMVVAGVAAVAS
jgi:hypothetical protein